MTGQTPRDYAENMAKMKEAKEGFTLIKQAVGFHNPAMMRATPGGWYDEPRSGPPHSDRGLLTERGLAEIIARVEAMKKVLGDEIGLALDCGPGWTVKDAITFARGWSHTTSPGSKTSSPATIRRTPTPKSFARSRKAPRYRSTRANRST
jgi:L-alanine-DL-glutamate epimerase-like enolase superfamily enzyme